MNMMKKFAMILLCLTFTAFLFACDAELNDLVNDCKTHIDANNNGECDECGDKIIADEPNEDPDENPDAENPEDDDPDAENPEGDDTDAENPEDDDPDAENPEDDDPDAEKPEGDDPDAEKPEGDDPNAEKPEGDDSNDEKLEGDNGENNDFVDPKPDISTDTNNPEQTSDIEKFLTAIEEATNKAEAIQFHISAKILTESGMYMDEDGNLTDEVSLSQKFGYIIDATAIIAKTEIGADAKLIITMSDPEDEYSETEEIYLIGNKCYTYSAERGGYIENDFSEGGINADSFAGIIAEYLPEGFEIPELTEEEMISIKQTLVSAFESTFALDEEGNFVFVADAAPELNEALKFLLSVDYEKETIGTALNAAISMVDPALTVEALLDEMAKLGSVTVKEALDEIDALLKSEADMTLDELYKEIINNEDIIELLYASGLSDEEIKAFQSISGIREFLKPEHLELTLDHIAELAMRTVSGEAMYEPKADDVPTITVADLVEQIKKEILPIPLSAIVTEDILAMLKNIEINALGGDITFIVGENLTFGGMKVTAKVDVLISSMTQISEDEYCRIDEANDIEISVEMTLDDKKTVIELPEGAEILDDVVIEDSIGDIIVNDGIKNEEVTEKNEQVIVTPNVSADYN